MTRLTTSGCHVLHDGELYGVVEGHAALALSPQRRLHVGFVPAKSDGDSYVFSFILSGDELSAALALLGLTAGSLPQQKIELSLVLNFAERSDAACTCDRRDGSDCKGASAHRPIGWFKGHVPQEPRQRSKVRLHMLRSPESMFCQVIPAEPSVEAAVA